tara:strand:- start:746 stop:1369 length:624 start_codon:yes stop_codon:yes gene_type:complete
MSFLFIIVGQVRCLNTFSKLLDKLKLEDIIYCGYSDDIIHFSLKKNTDFVTISDISEIIKLLPKNLNKSYFQRNMIQWFHLHNCIINKYNKIKGYDFIVKIRTDTIIQEDINLFKEKISNIDDYTIYFNTDKMFISKSQCFLENFKDFYDSIECSKKGMWASELQTQLFISKKFKKSYSIETLNLKVIYINRGNFKKIPGEGRSIIF